MDFLSWIVINLKWIVLLCVFCFLFSIGYFQYAGFSGFLGFGICALLWWGWMSIGEG